MSCYLLPSLSLQLHKVAFAAMASLWVGCKGSQPTHLLLTHKNLFAQNHKSDLAIMFRKLLGAHGFRLPAIGSDLHPCFFCFWLCFWKFKEFCTFNLSNCLSVALSPPKDAAILLLCLLKGFMNQNCCFVELKHKVSSQLLHLVTYLSPSTYIYI